MRLASAAAYDIRLQFRHGFYYAYLVFTVLYAVILRLLGPEIRETVAVLLIFTDPAMLGVFFVGGIVFLEREENSLTSLFVTPLRRREYYLSKIISLTLLALVTAAAIAVAGTGKIRLNWFSLIPGVVLTSGLFILAGLALASRSDSVVTYMLTAVPVFLVASVPLINFFGLTDWDWLYIFPAQASLTLIGGAFPSRSVSWGEAAVSVAVLLAYNGAAWLWADRWFTRYVIEGRRGDR